MVFPVVGGDGKPTGYDIDNSLRFNDGDSAQLSRSFTADPDTRKKFTISFWAKRGELGSDNAVFGARTTANFWSRLHFDSSDRIRLQNVASGSTDVEFEASAKLLDPSAWYHIVFAVDTTQSAISDGVKLYINGTRITDTSSTNYSQNATFEFARNGTTNYIGRDDENSSFFDGYISEFYYVDNQQLAPTAFGETNDNGVWIPIDAKDDITFGANGFYLEFKQTGTSQNSSGIGADTSGNDEHFAVANLAATDVTTDTPTNNFCTLNPLSAGSDMRANGSFKEGNCELVNGDTTGESNGQKCQGTMGFANGKWYWEVKLISNTMTAGIVDSSISTASDINLGSKNAVTYDSETGIINNISGNVQGETVSSQYDDGDIIGVAVDADNGAVYFAKNNTYQNSGNPTSGASKTGGATFTLGNQMLPLAADNSSATAGNHQYNFGNAPFSISSGNADANGYGNFEYAPPSGFYSLCTKNLAQFG